MIMAGTDPNKESADSKVCESKLKKHGKPQSDPLNRKKALLAFAI
jgi:hypothetical protein